MGRTACYFVFLIVFLLPLGHVDMAESPFWYCGISNYTANSTYGHNLRRALASLAANVSLSSFYNATEGRKPDQATAAVQCRGDLVGETCQACVSESTTQVIQRCPSSRAAGFALRACILHYRDASVPLPAFFMYMSFPGPGAIPDPQRFRPMLISFFNNLIVSAITSPEHLFWADKFEYTNNVTVYGTAQCIAILAPQDCKACLDITFTRMLKDTADRQGGTIFYRMTCSVRYETYPFFTPSSHQIAFNRLNFVASNCSPPASSGMAATPFHRNLKILLPLLTEETPISGFYDDAIGLGSNQVHGQVLCRGDVSVDVCWNCTAQASAKIQELCPSSRRATVWLDRCQLRYSDVNFAGAEDVYDRACVPAPEDASSPASFNQNLRMLISNLTLLVAQSFPISLFATGTCVVSDSQRIYALVQCVRDIPVDQCKWCLQNASADIEGCCNGKQGGRVLRGSCNLRFEVEPFFLGDPTFVSLPQPGHRHKRWWIFAIVGIIGGIVLAGVLWALCLARRRRPLLKILKYKEASSLDVGSIEEDKVNYDLPQISLKAIQSATNNFSEENKLGEGGYGPVYKGKLPNGQEVAVKRPSGNSGQGLKEFRNEIELIAKLQHINLVRLIGCCLEKGEKLLIYEYMPNKSLDAVLKDPEGHISLDWGKRSNIIMGIARGLLYLHQDSRLNIIHRDLKAGNVLLDEQLNPKISDFGMARIFSGVHGQATTSVVVGTYGYMAPEYAMEGVFSTKSDVYSFGILLLEIISGQLNASFVAIHRAHTLVEHAWRSWCEQKGTDFVDAFMKDTSSTIEMLRCLQIGLLCTQEDAASRPSMSTVVLMLGNPSLDLPLPTQPSFIRENVAESCQLLSSDRESASH